MFQIILSILVIVDKGGYMALYTVQRTWL